jgi:D-alanyl-D-alanine carboxypeptidase/D-alanyl-D-alanine-endopeptidase (penicillin-binding protein 4)
VLHGFLAQAGVRTDEYVFYDGSGLSRENLVTPQAMVKLLTYAASQPWFSMYRDTLPVGGTDGSLSDRFKGGPAEGRVLAKTGSLGHVNTLSGYIDTKHAGTVVFSIMGNNHNLHGKRALDTVDSIVEAIVESAPAK